MELIPNFKEFKTQKLLESLSLSNTDEEKIEIMSELFYDELKDSNEIIDEGIISSIIGGGAGFFFGPIIGKVIIKSLGVEKGILYDLFASNLVGAAIGAALAKHLTNK